MQKKEKKVNRFTKYIGHALLIGFVVSVLSLDVAAARRPVIDFTGDSRTDFVTLSAASSTDPLVWKVLRNPGSEGFSRIFNWGVGNDSITPGDFIGDGKWEPGVWRTGIFYITPFFETSVPPPSYFYWGQAGDTLARDGDFDGDGKQDRVVVRTISGRYNWFMQLSSGGTRQVIFGASAPGGASVLRFRGADFTGDGRDEIVVTYINTTTNDAVWYIGDSITGAQIAQINWGNFENQFLIQPDDYTGDGIADLAVFGAGNDGYWYIRNTATGALLPPIRFGITDPTFVAPDVPCRGDFDGDNIADIAIFRGSTREFWWRNSSNGASGTQQWGDAGDTALCTFFVF